VGQKRKQQALSDARCELFLAALRECGNLGQAAREASPGASGDCSRTFRDRRRADPVFEQAVQDALEDFRDKIRQEAYRRGIQGVPVDVIGPTGTVIGQRVVASDRVLLELMRGRLKEHQPVRRVEATVSSTVVQTTTRSDLAMKLEELTPENRRKLKEILEDQLARRKREEHSGTTAAQPTDGLEERER
jgi:hypothetical protein